MADLERPRYFRGALGAYLISFALTAVILFCNPELRPYPPTLGAWLGGLIGFSAMPVLAGTLLGLLRVMLVKQPFAKSYLAASTAVLLILCVPDLLKWLTGLWGSPAP